MMIQIPKEELLESLKLGYEEVRDCISTGNDEVDIAHVKGYCVTLEQILAAYGEVTKEGMLQIKRPILGNMSLRRKVKAIDSDMDMIIDTPTIFRKKIDLNSKTK